MAIQNEHKNNANAQMQILTDIPLWKNENLNGTIQDMAKAWGWDRETVARFLDNLEQLGVLTVQTTGNRKTFMLKYSTEK